MTYLPQTTSSYWSGGQSRLLLPLKQSTCWLSWDPWHVTDWPRVDLSHLSGPLPNQNSFRYSPRKDSTSVTMSRYPSVVHLLLCQGGMWYVLQPRPQTFLPKCCHLRGKPWPSFWFFLPTIPWGFLTPDMNRCKLSLENETQQQPLEDKNRHFQTWLPNFSLTQPVISCVTFNKLLLTSPASGLA